jgi:hypothetical protein
MPNWDFIGHAVLSVRTIRSQSILNDNVREGYQKTFMSLASISKLSLELESLYRLSFGSVQ